MHGKKQVAAINSRFAPSFIAFCSVSFRHSSSLDQSRCIADPTQIGESRMASVCVFVTASRSCLIIIASFANWVSIAAKHGFDAPWSKMYAFVLALVSPECGLNSSLMEWFFLLHPSNSHRLEREHCSSHPAIVKSLVGIAHSTRFPVGVALGILSVLGGAFRAR